jgi:hypothetical protein
MNYNKTFRKINLLLLILLLFVGCQKSQKIDIQTIEPVLNIEKKQILVNKPKSGVLDSYLIGDWENSNTSSNMMYNISISPKGILTYSSGPFSEKMKIKFEKNIMKLYFISIEGSNSFNESTKYVKQKNDSEKLIGTMRLKNKFLIIESFGDKCGQLSEGKYTLNKIIL